MKRPSERIVSDDRVDQVSPGPETVGGRGRRAGWLLATTLLALSLWLVAGEISLTRASETLADRRARVESLPPSELAALQQKRKRFDNLSAAQQQRLRQLHAAIQGRGDHELLAETVQRYSEWLATLTTTQRSDLLQLPPDQRIERIRELKRAREEERLNRSLQLGRDDARRVFEWLDRLLARDEPRLREALNEKERQMVDRIDDGRRRRFFVMHFAVRHRGQEFLRDPSEADIEELVTELSPKARDQITQLSSVQEKRQRIDNWIQAAIFSQFHRRPVSTEELEEYFTKQLTSEEREKLERLPREELMEELRQRYHEDRRRRWRSRGPNRRGGPPFGPPGRSDRDRRFPPDRPPGPPPERRLKREGEAGEVPAEPPSRRSVPAQPERRPPR